MIYLDTNIVIFLHDGVTERFSRAALKRLEAEDLVISPLVLLEIAYLHESKRFTATPDEVRRKLRHEAGVHVREVPLARLVDVAVQQTWTRDPFDRMIASQTLAERIHLMTCDATILKHVPLAFWP